VVGERGKKRGDHIEGEFRACCKHRPFPCCAPNRRGLRFSARARDARSNRLNVAGNKNALKTGLCSAKPSRSAGNCESFYANHGRSSKDQVSTAITSGCIVAARDHLSLGVLTRASQCAQLPTPSLKRLKGNLGSFRKMPSRVLD
jgi:hypothetical protein